jgi:hypothetical protein
MCARQAEHRHDRVADVLLDLAAVTRDLGHHRGEVALSDFVQRLGIDPLAERGRAHEVGNDDGDGLADLVRRQRTGAVSSGSPQYPHLRNFGGLCSWQRLHVITTNYQSRGCRRMVNAACESRCAGAIDAAHQVKRAQRVVGQSELLRLCACDVPIEHRRGRHEAQRHATPRARRVVGLGAVQQETSCSDIWPAARTRSAAFDSSYSEASNS